MVLLATTFESLPLLATIITSVALVIRAWIRFRGTKLTENGKSELRRLLFKDCTPAQRAKILRALRQNRDESRD
jgi:hypothetical protein